MSDLRPKMCRNRRRIEGKATLSTGCGSCWKSNAEIDKDGCPHDYLPKRLADAEAMADALRDMLHQLDMRDDETGEAVVEVSTMFNGAGKRWGKTVKNARAARAKWEAGK